MNLKIIYLKDATKFLQKNSILKKSEVDNLVIKAIKKIKLNENNNIDLKKLKGELQNFYRIRKGKVRILFKIVDNEVMIEIIVDNIDFKGDIYK